MRTILRCRINYVLMLQCHQASSSKMAGVLLQGCSAYTVLWIATLTVLGMTIKHTPYITWPSLAEDTVIVYPFALMGCCTAAFVAMQVNSGGWFLGCCWNIVRSPMVPVQLKDFYIADQVSDEIRVILLLVL